MGDDIWGKFEPSRKNSYSKMDDDFWESYERPRNDFLQESNIFYIFFGIVFVFAILIICCRACKGDSYQRYRSNRQFPTVIPPPPPPTNSSK